MPAENSMNESQQPIDVNAIPSREPAQSELIWWSEQTFPPLVERLK
jgi:hypothetical protein